MDQVGKRINVVFFKTESGNEPVREWLKHELDEEQRYSVGTDLKTVEYRWPIGMPTVRKIQAHLWELRSTVQDGITRVFFTVIANQMILLHGVIKKSRKVKLDDLQTARRRLQQVQKKVN